nr:hypothetical protein [Tanacetum cinerariifolium]
SQQRNPWTKKQKKDYYMAVIRSNLGWKVKDFRGMTFEEVEAKFNSVWKQMEDFIPMGSKEEAERIKRNGLSLEEDLNQLWRLGKETLSNRPHTSDKKMELWVELRSWSIKFRGGLLGIKCTRHSHCQCDNNLRRSLINSFQQLEESHAQVYHLDLEHAQKVLSMQDDEAEPAKLKEVIEVVTTAKLMTEVVIVAATTITAAPSAARRRKGVVIRDPEETTTPSVIVHSESKSKDKGKGILVEEPKPLKKQAQIEQDEAYARELEAELKANIN